jgi:hypothetical protein
MSDTSPFLRSVYILGDGMLFDDIIAHMLSSVGNLRVIKRVYQGESAFVIDVNKYRPDVILLTETDRYSGEQMLSLPSQMQLSADLRVIVISMEHKNIQILDRPAGWGQISAGVSHTLLDIDNWNDLLDLVTGKRFCRVDIQ